jgi:hypothetical protein
VAELLTILGEVVRTIILVMMIPWLAWFSVRVINLEKKVSKELAVLEKGQGQPCAQHNVVVKDIFDRLNTLDTNVAEMHGWLKGKFDK